jgi:hypothetical protein
VTERCSKSGKRESMGVVRTFVCHGVECCEALRERDWRRS